MRVRDFRSRDLRTTCIQLQPGSAVLTWLRRLPGGRSPNWAGSPAGGEPAEGPWRVRAEAGLTRSWKSREGVNLRNGGSWTVWEVGERMGRRDGSEESEFDQRVQVDQLPEIPVPFRVVS